LGAWRGVAQLGKVGRNRRSLGGLCNCLFLFGILQYRSSENWKRSEFVAAQIKEFNSHKINHAVLLMMDYDPAHVELFPEKTNVERSLC
jgi:hypothetical protein